MSSPDHTTNIDWDILVQLRSKDFAFTYTEDSLYIPEPTLGDLIRVCGSDFSVLRHVLMNSGSYMFEATGYNGRRQAGGSYTRSNTPEQAVALLWLMLRKADIDYVQKYAARP